MSRICGLPCRWEQPVILAGKSPLGSDSLFVTGKVVGPKTAKHDALRVFVRAEILDHGGNGDLTG
jgi:hypothetical protein